MNRLQIIAVLGLSALPGRSAANDVPGDRPPVDAGRDTRTTVRSDAPASNRLDASGGSYADEASTPEPDVAVPDVPSPPPDVAVPPPDGSPPPPDGTSPPPIDSPPPPPVDVTPQSGRRFVSRQFHRQRRCLVDAGRRHRGRAVARPPGASRRRRREPRFMDADRRSASHRDFARNLVGHDDFRDQQLTEFKFVKLEGRRPWENWLPYDSNQSLRVECFGDAGASDAADADATTRPMNPPTEQRTSMPPPPATSPPTHHRATAPSIQSPTEPEPTPPPPTES